MRSDKIKVGPQAAPHRSLLYALGLTDEELKKPLIGIVSSQNDIVPGHMNLDKIVQAVKLNKALPLLAVFLSSSPLLPFATVSPWDTKA